MSAMGLAGDGSSVLTILGIRHHGPGSARALRSALELLAPDCLLIEGPPEAEGLLSAAADAAMIPPVAIRIFSPERPDRIFHFPLAEFSPEWQAMRYAQGRGIAPGLIDLPLASQLALDGAEDGEGEGVIPDLLEGLAGGEAWWQRVIEERLPGPEIFPEIAVAMRELRAGCGERPRMERLREAAMRQGIREALERGWRRVAVVCGAWHVPLLDVTDPSTPDAGEDQRLLSGLPVVATSVAWVPWSDSRLGSAAGYGAGVESPGWLRHLWEFAERETAVDPCGIGGERIGIEWVGKVVGLLRREGRDASPAGAIDAVRLAGALAAMRGLGRPGIAELSEAVETVFFAGDEKARRLVRERLVTGQRVGAVPRGAGGDPLTDDWHEQCRRLRLVVSGSPRRLVLDLRRPTGLARSRLLHRLALLGISWARRLKTVGGQGTFREEWELCRTPQVDEELSLAAPFGPTVERASAARVLESLPSVDSLARLSELLVAVIAAELPATLDPLLERFESLMLDERELLTLLRVLPPLVEARRYGSVRTGVDGSLCGRLDELLARLTPRLFVGLPLAATAAGPAEARAILEAMRGLDRAILLTGRPADAVSWRETLRYLLDRQGVASLIAGGAFGLLLLDGHGRDGFAAEAQRRLEVVFSPAADPMEVSLWLAGLLSLTEGVLPDGSPVLGVVDRWLESLDEERFRLALPLLRRAFAAIPPAERHRLLADRLRQGAASLEDQDQLPDPQRAMLVLPILATMLGLRLPADQPGGAR